VKYLYIFFFLIFISCGANNKAYICGERSCVDKKEFNEYFAKNLIIEVKIKKSQKKKSLSLIEINNKQTNTPKKNIASSKKNSELIKKKEKLLLKAEKNRLKKMRKIKKQELKKKLKNKKKLAKLQKSKINNKKNIPTNFFKKNKISEINKKIPTNSKKKNTDFHSTKVLKSTNSTIQVSVCAGVTNCDIDKITELLIKKGKEKDFPNISSQ